MEQPSITSPEIKKRDVFDEYSSELNYVLESIDDLDANSQANYRSVNLGDRIVFVRVDVLEDIEKRSKGFSPYEYKGLLRELLPEIPPVVHKVLRPVFRKRYESNEKKKTEDVEKYREETKIQLIRNMEAEDKKRVEVVKFIESFPVDIQQRLKAGAFLIDFEGRYYPSVEDGEK